MDPAIRRRGAGGVAGARGAGMRIRRGARAGAYVHVFQSVLRWNSNRFAVEPAAGALLLTSSGIQMPFSAAVS
jgi:hypothetical protein